MKKYFILLITSFALLVVSCKQTEKTIAETETYTCSMDPQVIEHQPGKCPICHMDLIKVTGLGNKDGIIKLSDQQIELGNIKTEIATIQLISTEKTLPAVVAFNQHLSSTVTSRIEGRIEKLYYKTIGDKIEKGAPVFQIYSEQLMRDEQNLLLAIQQEKNNTSTTIEKSQIIEAAKQKLILWGMNRDQIFELQRKGIPESVLTVYSEVTGVVTDIAIKEGDYVMEGSTVYKVADLTTVWVEAQLYAEEATTLSSNEIAEVTFPFFPEKILRSKISFAYPELMSESKLIIARIEISNSAFEFKPGMQAYITLKGNERKTLAVTSSSIIHGSNGLIIWVKKSDGSFEPRMVTAGLENNTFTEILSGIQEGDIVVNSGAYLLQSEFVFKKGTDVMAGMKM